MARVLDAISSHRAGRLSCVEAGELLGFRSPFVTPKATFSSGLSRRRQNYPYSMCLISPQDRMRNADDPASACALLERGDSHEAGLFWRRLFVCARADGRT
jgi:hypothetical protein